MRAAQLLLAAGAQRDPVNSSSETPLLLAAQCGQKAMVSLLGGRGANVEAVDSTNMTALAAAASRGHEQMVEALLAAGAAPDAQGGAGCSPLHAGVKHPAVVRALVAAGADVERRHSGTGGTPLLRAVRAGAAESVRVLLAAGARTAARARNGDTPLICATSIGACKVVSELLVAGADVHAASLRGNFATALHVAANCGSLETVSLLLAAGASPTATDRQDAMPLHYAVRAGHPALVPLLAAGGVAVNHCSAIGSPMEMAFKQRLFPGTAALVTAGARLWTLVPRPCPGIGAALLPIWLTSPKHLHPLRKRLSPRALALLRATLLCMPRLRPRLPHEVVVRILSHVLGGEA